jgi:hypothetical protein
MSTAINGGRQLLRGNLYRIHESKFTHNEVGRCIYYLKNLSQKDSIIWILCQRGKQEK